MSHKEFQKEFKYDQSIAPQAVAGAVANTYLSMDDAFGAFVMIDIGTHTTDVVVNVYEAKTAAGGDAQLLTGKTKTVAAADANTLSVIEVNAREMSDGFKFVGIVTSCAAGAGVVLGVLIIRGPCRYCPPGDYV